MNELQIFNSEEFGDIRTVTIENEPWFVGKDVAEALGYSNASKAVSTHVGEEDRILKVLEADSQNGNVVKTQTALINESGLYALIFGSKLESAKRFKHWVTSEVLPAIRKTGSYQKPMTTDQKIQLLAQGNVELTEKIDKVDKDLQEFKADMPLLALECQRITRAKNQKVVPLMGGKNAPAYKNKSLMHKVYSSDYIEITDDVISIRFQNDGTSYFNFCIYDADKNRLEGAGGVSNTLFTPTEKSKYFAISYWVDSGRSDYPKITKTYKAPFSGGSYKLEKDFGYIDKAEIEFTKGAKNARVAVDYLMIGDPANYTIRRNDLSDYPECTLENRAHKVALVKTVYSETSEESNEIVSENVTVTENNQVHEIYFSNASYGLSVATNNTAIKAEIVEWGNFYVKVKFTGVTASADVTVTVSGKEYVVTQKTDMANTSEKYQEWENPLISEDSPELEKWIEDYYSSVIDYSLEWRGDPRVDANDAFYLEKKNGRTALIQAYENEIEFNGRFSGKIKARQVDM